MKEYQLWQTGRISSLPRMKRAITRTLQFKEIPLGIIKSKKIIKPVQFQHSKFTSVAGKCHGFYQGISMLFSICLIKKKKMLRQLSSLKS